MRYQLVLQFAANTVADYDALIAIERQLIETLGESSVDGHDMGSSEANIFILTTDPQNTFRQLAPVLVRTGHMPADQQTPRDSSVLHSTSGSNSYWLGREPLGRESCCTHSDRQQLP
jgi:hypothetical protein